MSEMQVMDRTGHLTVTWNADNEAEVKAARETFDALREKGHRAFRARRFGKPGERLDEFDPTVERMTIIPHLAGG